MRASVVISAAFALAVSAQSTTTTTSAAQGALPAPSSTVVAAPGTLKLGAECSETSQCAGGAECFASNFMQVKACGKFNAACKTDSQCATNSCNNGLCNGFLSSSASPSSTTAQGALPAPSSTVVAAPGTLKLGAECSETSQCAGGAECFASNFMQVKACGKFNAACKTDSQCATNTCNNGLCNGFLATTLSSSTAAPTTTGTPQIAIDAVPGSLKLGQQCSEKSQCAGGADCYASNSMLQKSCGNFNAACTTNAQCAYNTCSNGLCSGFLPSASYPANTATATGKTNGTAVATGRPSATTTGVTKFTGAASKEQVGAGVALLAALFAAAL
ncbi:Hypothetical protein D9617_21g098220 [Elsinoe fawcettii]|nr:Hypothetical protein D9617_21g098220 [Elsinoe fawcettii]